MMWLVISVSKVCYHDNHCYMLVILSSIESPTTSTYSSPVMAHKTFVSRVGPRRHKKSQESFSADSKEPAEAFATARGTVKAKRRFSNDDGVGGVITLSNQKLHLVRASSDSNIIHNHDVSSQQSQQLSSDSSNSLSNYQQVAPADKLSPLHPPSESDTGEEVKIKTQFTRDTSQTFSTGSDHYGDIESEGEEVKSPDPSGPTPKVSIQLPVSLQVDSPHMTPTCSNNGNCSNLVSEMVEQFPSLLTTTASPVLLNISQRNDFSLSLPNNLHMVGLEQVCGDRHSANSAKRCNSITGSVECVTATGNSWLNKVVEGRTLSEIHEDSAESRASTRSPSPPADGTLRSRSDEYGSAAQISITKLESKKSESFDRKLAALQDNEQSRGLFRTRTNENGRRGSFLARLLPMRGKGKRHQSDSVMLSSSANKQVMEKALHAQLIPVRPISPSFDSTLSASTLKPAASKKTRFPSVLRRKKEITEPTLSPTGRDFSMSGGRLSPSPGALYSNNVLHQRNILLSIYGNLNYWICRHKEVSHVIMS